MQPTAPATATGNTVKKIIIRSGDMEFEVDSFDAAVAAVVRLIGITRDAFVATVNSEKLANGKMRGSVVVRMPPERLDEFVLELQQGPLEVGRPQGPNASAARTSPSITPTWRASSGPICTGGDPAPARYPQKRQGREEDLLAVEKDKRLPREDRTDRGGAPLLRQPRGPQHAPGNAPGEGIRAAAAFTETERVSTGIEVEDVEKAYHEAQAAIREMKGRISQAEMKQQAAGQFNAKLVFEIAPGAGGPDARTGSGSLGNMVRLEMDRVQKIDNGGEPTKDGKIRRGDTEFHVSLYNLANVEPRETTLLTLVAADVPAAYRKLRDTLAKLKTTMRDAALREQDKSTVVAVVDFDVRRVDEPAAQQAVEAASARSSTGNRGRRPPRPTTSPTPRSGSRSASCRCRRSSRARRFAGPSRWPTFRRRFARCRRRGRHRRRSRAR